MYLVFHILLFQLRSLFTFKDRVTETATSAPSTTSSKVLHDVFLDPKSAKPAIRISSSTGSLTSPQPYFDQSTFTEIPSDEISSKTKKHLNSDRWLKEKPFELPILSESSVKKTSAQDHTKSMEIYICDLYECFTSN